MVRVYTPPSDINKEVRGISIFLAGSIEMGKAKEWQQDVIEKLKVKYQDEKDVNLSILNPRRADWDSSWEQKMSNPEFNEQVNWELDGIEMATIVFFYFQPGTISPISLLEFGTQSVFHNNVVVVCPEGYEKKGNVDIVCKREGIPVLESIKDGVALLEGKLDNYFKTYTV